MSKDQKEIIVDGKSYFYLMYPPKDGRAMLFKLLKLLGEPLLMLLISSSGKELKDILENKIEEILPLFSQAFKGILEKLDADEFELLFQKILSTTMLKDNGSLRHISPEIDFQGQYLHQFKLLQAVLQGQFADFLGGNAGTV